MPGQKDGDTYPFFRKGEMISASKLNQIVALITRKIVGAAPVKVTRVAGGLTIGLDFLGRRGRPAGVPCIVTSAGSGGSYLVDTYEDGYSSPAGRTGVTAYPVDSSTTFVVDQKLTMIATHTKNFLVSGGGGSTVKCFQITANHDDGTYDGLEYDEPEGTLVGGSGADTVLLKEDNGSVDVPLDQWVRGYPGGTSSSSPDFWFSMPFGCSS